MPLAMRTTLARKSAALLRAAAFVLAGARAAEAGRAQARKATIAGAKIKSWKSGNTDFTHESLKDGRGNVIHFERTAKKVGQKGGTTKVSGKTWGSSFKGHEWSRGNLSFRAIAMKGADGSKTKHFTVTDAKGTRRTTITGLPGGVTRRITTWKAGGALMTHTRDYVGSKLVAQQKTVNKAK
jgi:hypothetical protein